MSEIMASLEDVLAARDERAAVQGQLATRWAMPVASITLVWPGPAKDSPKRRTALDVALARFEAALKRDGISVPEIRRKDSPSGPEAILAVGCSPEKLKLKALEVEDSLPWGRLLDIDVLVPGESRRVVRREDLGREPRKCLVCDKPAFECMRAGTHDRTELTAAAEGLMAAPEWRNLPDTIADLAVRALEAEADLDGKPGLVCPGSRGAHDDMDHAMLIASAHALRATFRECAAEGAAFRGADLLAKLRPIGLAGEAKMFGVTGGVNTHKGAIFSLGLLCAASGRIFGGSCVLPQRDVADHVGREVASICKGIVSLELKSGAGLENTAGGRCFASTGARGARGQAESGYAFVRERLLPILHRARVSDGFAVRAARLDALLTSMSVLDDTCLLSRGGQAGLEKAQRGALKILTEGGAGEPRGAVLLADLDRDLCAQGLSPGGSADMLAVALFLESLETYFARNS